MDVRPPALAGPWYPADPAALAQCVDGFLAAPEPRPAAPSPKALVAPHAGLVYSGPVAASAYARWTDPAIIERVVLLGPAHRVAFRGLCAPTVDAFATPLGPVPLDREALALLDDLPGVLRDDRPHAEEHSLEMHLPFLQRTLGEFRLVPLVVGAATTAEVREVLQRLWGGPETRIVVSSDLSHFHDHETAARLDRVTATAIETLDGDALDDHSACGRIPLRGLLAEARARGLQVETLDVRTSGDTAGDRRRVVGYGAWAFTDG
tara:strand:- start:276 stop:1067 length:792 start_codon:yes stop_codon:yes gene_type:complete